MEDIMFQEQAEESNIQFDQEQQHQRDVQANEDQRQAELYADDDREWGCMEMTILSVDAKRLCGRRSVTQ